MELVYRISSNAKSSVQSLGHSSSSSPISATWSCNNLLAYPWEKVVKGYTERYVSIIDPNQPWDVHTISFDKASVKTLQWNQTGNKLLCSTSTGFCNVWISSNHLTNVWKEKSTYGCDLQGEDILASSWLSNGRKVVLHVDKLDNPKEKISRAHHRPSLAQLGGQPMEGYISVTGSGLVVVKCITVTQDDAPIVAKAQLSNTENFMLADIVYSNQGNIIVMATDCDINNPIKFWTIELRYNNDTNKLSLEVDVLPNITLKCVEDSAGKYNCITHARFVTGTSTECVVICAAGSTGSTVESWILKKVQPQVHPSFSSMSSSIEKMQKWQFVLSTPLSQRAVSISIPSIPVSSQTASIKAANEKNFFCGNAIAVAFPNNSIQLLHRITLAPLLTHSISDDLNQTTTTVLGKRQRKEDINSTIQHIEFSATSCALAVFDNNANLMMYKIAPWLQKMSPVGWMAAHHISQLLYFCIISGHEWWDVLLHMQTSTVNLVCEQLSKEFSNQSPPMQQMLKSRMLSVKISIYQQSHRTADAVDCHLRLMFEAITVVFRSLLQPPHDSMDDQAPADKLHEVCSSSFETDINKLLQCVDTDTQSLQSLQQLIQWIADVTLYILSVVPQPINSNTPGSSLIYDKEFLSILRELLVIIQTWKLLKSACSPVFCCFDDHIDGLSYIFKLLTEVYRAVSMGETQGRIPDNIIDECCLLPNQILIPSIDIIKPVDGVLQRLSVIPMPYRFEYDRKPPCSSLSNKISINKSSFLKPHDDSGKIDNLRRIFLGKSPVAALKTCTRCGMLSLLNPFPQSNIEFWDKRFTSYCICGGSWQKVTTGSKN
uniref:mediator of RNA polymerase II transcription subunit 16-like n=1 Tax=Styela clava TaxID=7725 RepID=UPI0019395FB4|nr:mediator of RNA polymerase II transcription subunit 16-like [Styela clava]